MRDNSKIENTSIKVHKMSSVNPKPLEVVQRVLTDQSLLNECALLKMVFGDGSLRQCKSVEYLSFYISCFTGEKNTS